MTKREQFVLELRKLEAKYGLWLETSEWLNLQDKPTKWPERQGSLSVLDPEEQSEVFAAESSDAAQVG